jgi:hypothetical protein
VCPWQENLSFEDSTVEVFLLIALPHLRPPTGRRFVISGLRNTGALMFGADGGPGGGLVQTI